MTNKLCPPRGLSLPLFILHLHLSNPVNPGSDFKAPLRPQEMLKKKGIIDIPNIAHDLTSQGLRDEAKTGGASGQTSRQIAAR